MHDQYDDAMYAYFLFLKREEEAKKVAKVWKLNDDRNKEKGQ